MIIERLLKTSKRRHSTEVDKIFDSLTDHISKEFIKAKFAEVNDSVKYIADIDSHKIVWINDTLKELLGSSEWKTSHCYAVLQDLPVPCEYCTNEQLVNEGEVIQWVHHNKKLGKTFLVRDFMRVIEGRRYRFENAIDITGNLTEIKRL